MNYRETMHYIKDTAKFGSNYGLSRTKKILEFLGNPEKKLKCIHIAGTNGKGSVTAMISKILVETGYSVGMYTSPFIEEFEERIQISGKNIPKNDLCKVVTELSTAVDKVIEMGYEHPTEFEIITCAALLYFYKKEVDYAVIEVGLGGRLDSTNVITPLISVITSISYDHMNILGNTLTEIAHEKAGIIKDNIPVILYPQKEESEIVIEETCEKHNSKLIKVSRESVEFIDTFKSQEDLKYYQHIKVTTKDKIYNIKLSLLGKYQLLNCSTAIHCIEELRAMGINIKDEHIERALEKVVWRGRLEVLSDYPLIVLDGAHNIDGIKNLSESIDSYFTYDNIVLILGILADKEVESMVKIITPKAKNIITVTPHSDRAEIAKDLCDIVKKFNSNCESFDDYRKAFIKAKKYCNNNDLLLISGSLYMIGDMRKIINSSIEFVQ
ncbi:bifunctional folylpolyglutamate synthase/dihydrofolate synthase [Clostridium pasteurianum]|uniref:bifunctional folylpolyglutamate synthase/dihydrofolate synthase n=1 Tax=Clostridium pasteurianum TaxID=1501 RepID=UPI002260F82C|nr:folylpolyglutamate synthase/dihydrofolate synthase family protein [Clostridium pasteurianum]UZW15883.1 bifunctional folylpolyglutamate synthase/dihydrofolate synthase [Clostridium pasteurianum]